jgi:uncharacterized protein YjiS (DUF1127 family)
MAEMMELARRSDRPGRMLGALVGALRTIVRLRSQVKPRLRVEDWPDYRLRDVGLSRSGVERPDPRAYPVGWPLP